MKLESLAIIKKQSKRRPLSPIIEGGITRRNSTETECRSLRRHKENPEVSLEGQTCGSPGSLPGRACRPSSEAKMASQSQLHQAASDLATAPCHMPGRAQEARRGDKGDQVVRKRRCGEQEEETEKAELRKPRVFFVGPKVTMRS